MNKQERLDRRRELAITKREKNREQNIILGYFNTKYPVLYKEATKFYQELNKQYPTTKNLLNTPGFKHFKSTTISMDTMVLEIPIDKPTNPIVKETDMGPEETEQEVETTFPDLEMNEPMQMVVKETDMGPEETEQEVETSFPDLEMNELLPEIPRHIVDDIISNLRADPDLNMMMGEDMVDSDIDVYINDDDRLEDELRW